MKSFLILFTYIFVFTGYGQNVKYIDYIGKEYRSLTDFEAFSDWDDYGGMLINHNEETEFAFAHYHKDSTHLIVFEEMRSVEEGYGMFTFLDAVEITGLDSDQYVIYGLCRINGEDNSNIIAVYQDNETEEESYKNILYAWKANRKRYLIERIPVEGIECVNEGFGCSH